MQSKSKISQIAYTLIFWSCFLMLPFLFFPHGHEKSALDSERFVSWSVYSVLYLAAFYYFNSGVLIPKLLAYKKIFLYTLIVVALFFLYLAIYYLIWKYSSETIQFMATHPNRLPRNFWLIFFSFGPTFLFLIAFTFSSVSNIISRWFYAEERKDEITKQQLETELSLLRSQMNPHFLFNSLNSIYSLTLSNNPKSSDAVMKLSRIMRYTLEESQSEYVPLNDELAFINSYLELQRLRATEKTHIVFDVDEAVNDVKIPPLLLIPFIENAFKFGVSARQETQIKVAIHVVEKTLFFTCENDIVPNLSTPEGTGTGIINVKRRLELLYDKNYQLNISNDNGKYSVLLELKVEA
ncbi:sensor histidine kinase [Arachidicoccus ginsenosidimutans]|uniref:sensor histidine kinase n=1 Tax=Arachidicoccus sp. BS20 TaxID=1850526 RepID=UPI000A935AAC|nr:histidine kinase [Arachidicoccus sp. BS20]